MVDFKKLSEKLKQKEEEGDSSFDYGFNEPEPIREVEPICMGRVKCIHCGKIYGFCSTIEYTVGVFNSESPKGETEMLPASTAGKPQTQSTGNRQQSGGRSGLNYIKPANLTTDKAIAKILDVRVAEPPQDGTRNFSDIRFKIALRGVTWLYGVRLNNPELKKLQDAFGLDENNYPGKKFYMYVQEDEFDGRIYMRVEPITEDEEEEAEPSPVPQTRKPRKG